MAVKQQISMRRRKRGPQGSASVRVLLLVALLLATHSLLLVVIDGYKNDTGGRQQMAVDSTLGQQQQKQGSRNHHNEEKTTDDDRIHIVISSACNANQDWQSYVFFHRVMAVGFQGKVTRVASCKSNETANELHRVHREQIQKTMSPQFLLHTAPDYANIVPGEKEYTFFNKPFGVRHWLEHGLGFPETLPQYEKTIFLLLDPDQLVLRSFVPNMTNEVWADGSSGHRAVKEGQPMAAMYHLHLDWTKDVDLEGLSQLNTTIRPVTAPTETSGLLPWIKLSPEQQNQVQKHYSVGPPYIAVASDFYKIVATWSEFVIPIYEQTGGEFLSEMFAYMAAAAHLNLPHQISTSFMASNVMDYAEVEAVWEKWIDNATSAQVCSSVSLDHNDNDNDNNNNKQKTATTMPRRHLPLVLHYCQMYYLGPYFFYKYYVPSDFLSCQHPLYEEPSPSVADIYHNAISSVHQQEEQEMDHKKRMRMAFALCQILPRMNAAAVFFKKQHCQPTTATTTTKNYDKVFRH